MQAGQDSKRPSLHHPLPLLFQLLQHKSPLVLLELLPKHKRSRLAVADLAQTLEQLGPDVRPQLILALLPANNNKDLEAVADLNVPLRGRREGVRDKGEDLGERKLARRRRKRRVRVRLVLEVDLVVEERLDERLGGSSCPAELALVGADRVKRVYSTGAWGRRAKIGGATSSAP